MRATILRSSLGLLMQVLLNYGNKSPYKAGDHIIALAAYLRSKLDLNGPILGVKQMFRPCVKTIKKDSREQKSRITTKDLYVCQWRTPLILVCSSSYCHNARGTWTKQIFYNSRSVCCFLPLYFPLWDTCSQSFSPTHHQAQRIILKPIRIFKYLQPPQQILYSLRYKRRYQEQNWNFVVLRWFISSKVCRDKQETRSIFQLT